MKGLVEMVTKIVGVVGGSWETQILNDTKKIAKSASWGKCQLGEMPVGGQAVRIGGNN